MTNSPDFCANLKRLQDAVKAMPGPNNVPLSEIMNDAFMQQHSDIRTFDQFIKASGIASIQELGSKRFSIFVQQTTSFADWKEMLNSAAKDWLENRREREHPSPRPNPWYGR